MRIVLMIISILFFLIALVATIGVFYRGTLNFDLGSCSLWISHGEACFATSLRYTTYRLWEVVMFADVLGLTAMLAALRKRKQIRPGFPVTK